MDPCFTLVLLTQNPTGEFLQIGVAHIGVRRHFFPKTVKRNTVANRVLDSTGGVTSTFIRVADVLKGRAFFLLADVVAFETVVGFGNLIAIGVAGWRKCNQGLRRNT